jgi:transposase
VRRFRCATDACRRAIFAERFPDLARAYARRTTRLSDVVELLGFVLGGEPGARAARALGVHTSPDTLIRTVRQAARPEPPTPRVLGVDDWCKRKGQSYGTILVDLERHRPIDLLPDREAATLAQWLRDHAGVEIVTRDRARAYADAIDQGAPNATQVADRWHILKNLTEALNRMLAVRQRTLREAARAVDDSSEGEAVRPPTETDTVASARTKAVSTGPARETYQRQRRLERYNEVRRLHQQGVPIKVIADHLRMHRRTVRLFVRAECFPERERPPRRSRIVDRFAPHLTQRWSEGCRNASLLFRELKGLGYGGCESGVRAYVRQWRPELPEEVRRSRAGGRGGQKREYSARHTAWMLCQEDDGLTPEQTVYIEKLTETWSETALARELATDFNKMVCQRQADQFESWVKRARASGIAELVGFADGLEQERSSIVAALELSWSNGQVEGQVHRLKLIKRQTYGRANFDLLKARVLYGT